MTQERPLKYTETMKTSRAKPRFVICIKNDEYPASLEVGKVYRLLPERIASPGMVRIVDESGDDYLYSKGCFVPIEVPRDAAKAIR
jgi:hypothetical protein